MLRRLVVYMAALFFFGSALLSAGVYNKVAKRVPLSSTDPMRVEPYTVVHPLGYDGTNSLIELSVCVGPNDGILVGSTQAAIAAWNAAQPSTSNCTNCTLWEEPLPPAGLLDSFSVVLHELGHCAMGLGHVNLVESELSPEIYRTGTCDADSDGVCGEPTSFSASVNSTEVVDNNGTRGDSEDEHVNVCPFMPAATLGNQTEESVFGPQALFQDASKAAASCSLLVNGTLTCPDPAICCPTCPGASCPLAPMVPQGISWYRETDNDPFVVDALAIDKDSYRRSLTTLPGGHSGPANANRGVSDLIGPANTQAIMYSRVVDGQAFSGLAADDLNMIKYARTGGDRDAGTADDYTVKLTYQNDCSGADIRVGLGSTQGSVAVCVSDIELSYPQSPLVFHYSVAKVAPLDWLVVDLEVNEDFDFGPWVFSSDFESGDTRAWGSTTP